MFISCYVLYSGEDPYLTRSLIASCVLLALVLFLLPWPTLFHQFMHVSGAYLFGPHRWWARMSHEWRAARQQRTAVIYAAADEPTRTLAAAPT
jgi:hypothetical protein